MRLLCESNECLWKSLASIGCWCARCNKNDTENATNMIQNSQFPVLNSYRFHRRVLYELIISLWCVIYTFIGVDFFLHFCWHSVALMCIVQLQHIDITESKCNAMCTRECHSGKMTPSTNRCCRYVHFKRYERYHHRHHHHRGSNVPNQADLFCIEWHEMNIRCNVIQWSYCSNFEFKCKSLMDQ